MLKSFVEFGTPLVAVLEVKDICINYFSINNSTRITNDMIYRNKFKIGYRNIVWTSYLSSFKVLGVRMKRSVQQWSSRIAARTGCSWIARNDAVFVERRQIQVLTRRPRRLPKRRWLRTKKRITRDTLRIYESRCLLRWCSLAKVKLWKFLLIFHHYPFFDFVFGHSDAWQFLLLDFMKCQSFVLSAMDPHN